MDEEISMVKEWKKHCPLAAYKKYKNCFLERYQPFDREIECGK